MLLTWSARRGCSRPSCEIHLAGGLLASTRSNPYCYAFSPAPLCSILVFALEVRGIKHVFVSRAHRLWRWYRFSLAMTIRSLFGTGHATLSHHRSVKHRISHSLLPRQLQSASHPCRRASLAVEQSSGSHFIID